MTSFQWGVVSTVLRLLLVTCGLAPSAPAQAQLTGWEKPSGDKPFWITADADRWARINATQALCNAKVSFDFDKTPLRNAVAQLGKQISVRITINEKELDSLGLDAEQEITAAAKQVTFREAMLQILKPFDLGVRFHESDIEVSSLDDLNSDPITRVYDLAYKFRTPIDLAQVCNVVSQTIDPDEWRDYGGTGSSTLQPFGSAIVVSAPDSTHWGVVQFLSKLSKFTHGDSLAGNLNKDKSLMPQLSMDSGSVSDTNKKMPTGSLQLPPGFNYQLVRIVDLPIGSVRSANDYAKPASWVQPSGVPPAWLNLNNNDSVQSIRLKLRDTASINFERKPLKEALDELMKDSRLSFWIDSAELDALSIPPLTPITLALEHTSIHSILSRMLSPLDLSYVIEANSLKITSNDDVQSDPTRRVYDMAFVTDKPLDMEVLLMTISSAVTPDEWRDFGGTGNAVMMAAGSQLFVAAPEASIAELESLLFQLAQIHPDNLPHAKAPNTKREIVIGSIPGGSTIKLPTDGTYEVLQINR